MKEGAAHVGYSAPLDYVLQLQPKYESLANMVTTFSGVFQSQHRLEILRNVNFVQVEFTLNRSLQVEKR